MQKEITLKNLGTVMGGDPTDKVILLIDGTNKIEEFLTHQGHIIDINKIYLRKQIGQISDEELDKEIRHTIVNRLQDGDKIGLFLDVCLNLIEFFGQFKWFDKSTFFNMKNLLSRDYFVKNNILHSDEDKDNFGNKGGWEPYGKAMLFVLINASTKEDFDKIKNNFPEENFEYVYVK